MKCQNLFSGKKNEKNISKCGLLKFLLRVLNIKEEFKITRAVAFL